MPSPHQHAANAEFYEEESVKVLATKNTETIRAVIRGIQSITRVNAYIDAERDLAAEQDREPRRSLIGELNRRAAAIREREG